MVLLASIILVGFSCNQTQHHDGEIQKSTYDKVIASNTIRVGYVVCPPSFIKDPKTGDFSGIMHDVMVEAGKSLEIKIDFVEELNWETMTEAVQTGKVDIVCTGLWPSGARGKFVDFTSAIYYSPITAYVKAGNKKFDGNLSNVNSADVKIARVDKQLTSIIAKADFPTANTELLPDNAEVPDILIAVASGKADITFVEVAVANEYMATHPNSIQAVANVPMQRVFSNVMMIPKGDVKFQSMLNYAFEELVNNVIVDKILTKYEKYPNSFLRLQRPYQVN